MEINVFKLAFTSVEMARRDIPKIRGFIANKYPDLDELHNHNSSGFFYRYPLIQYKLIDESPCIIGINEGSEMLKSIEKDINELNFNSQMIEIYEKNISIKRSYFGTSEQLLKYWFVSPWMCLNESNYAAYSKSNDDEKTELLKRILIGNILSMSKRFNYTVDKELNTFINLTPCRINFKNKEMIGFKGQFLINFCMPDYMGIGKSVSRGFGTIKRDVNQNYK